MHRKLFLVAVLAVLALAGRQARGAVVGGPISGGSGGGATNAVAQIQTNGVDLITSGATGINFVGATGMVSGTTAIIGGFSGGSGSGTIVTNPGVLFVATNGVDSTAVKGLASKPWLTLTNALLYATNGDTILIGPGTFRAQGRGEAAYSAFSDRLSAPLVINSLSNVTIQGSGRDTILQFTNVGHIFSIVNSEGITLRDFKMVGPGANLNNATPKAWTNIFGAITLWSARGTSFSPGATNRNMRFENLILEDIPDHGIVGVPDTRNFGVVVTGCEFRRVGDAYHPTAIGDGACVVSLGVGVVVNGNYFDDVQHGIEVENSFGSPSDTQSDWSITGNVLKNVWRHGITVWPGQNVTPSTWKRFAIVGNTIEMYPTAYPDITFPAAIQINGGSEISVLANTISGYHDYGISLTPSIAISNCIVMGNVDRGANNIGIVVENAPALVLDSKIINNTVQGGSSFAGIYLNGSGTHVSGNTVMDTTGHGVHVVFATVTTNNVIEGNVFERIGSTNIVVGPLVSNTVVGLNYTTMPAARRMVDAGVRTLKSQVWPDGSVSFFDGLGVAGNSYFSNALTASSMSVDQTLVVGGAALITGSATFGTNVTVGGTNVVNWQRMPNLTASRPLLLDSSKGVVSATGTPDGSKFLRDDGVLATPSGGSGGTNYPPVVSIVTNITVGSGVRQSLFIKTNSSFGFNFTGTPLNGEDVSLTVSNYSAATLYATSYVAGVVTAIFDPSVGSNVTVFAVPPGQRFFGFRSSTNAALGVARWDLVTSALREVELGPSTSITLSTNAAGTVVYANIAEGAAATNFTVRAVFTLPQLLTSKVMEVNSSGQATNSVVGMLGGNTFSNVAQVIFFLSSSTIVGANANQTVYFGTNNVADVLVSTNVTFTNFSGIVANVSATYSAFLKVTNSASNVSVNWGNLGGSNPGYGVALYTNANSPMWTTLTNTKTYLVTWMTRGTNIHTRISLEE